MFPSIFDYWFNELFEVNDDTNSNDDLLSYSETFNDN